MQHSPPETTTRHHDVVVIGGGAAGIAVTASLLRRRGDLDIAIIEPAEQHSYQPGWTLVGGGVFSADITRRPMRDVMPDKATWYASLAEMIDPERATVTLADGSCLGYQRLVVAPGLVVDWGAIDGLEATLGENGVTSNYRVDLAPYTWKLVQSLKQGKALFTQPPMPIKCAGAPQKAPAFIAGSRLGNDAGWLDIDAETLQHVRHPAIFGLGDASGTSNAKTAAAVRKQAPVVAENLLSSLEDQPLKAAYLGYGSCPLAVEKGRVVLAEFGYGGVLQPTFPSWLNDGTQPTRRAWWLKARQLPWLYWNGMLKGREWLAAPVCRDGA
ncbi:MULTISPECIES: NAD(P)/FAD-dependent oxidoreductase [Halomonas]|uniref:Pyridine nucleotide-disulfide oxidoreductase n=1 Tax=Halomonas ventosae TaxID=229007 RepID=A0A4R6HGB6_9GAMM|nr:FAD/NAD(P)-binding oxidoreductase [Halomonas ventosae]TDO07640.1 pyridine nucleotide-disulfide oxidoreductase [Halomonas ventosae]